MFRIKVVEKIKTHVFVQYLFPESSAFYDVTWKNIVDPEKPQGTI
jgi:hypothetical protein